VSTSVVVRGRSAAPLALAGATVAVSVSAILVQEARSDAATVVWLRMALAVGLLAPWALPQLRRGTVGGSRRDSLLVALAGILLAIHFLTWTASLMYTSVAASVLLVSLHPLIVAPLGRDSIDHAQRSAPGRSGGCCGTRARRPLCRSPSTACTRSRTRGSSRGE